MPVDYDPRLAAVQADPFPIFRRMQQDDPVHKSPILRGFVITRYADVKALLMNRTLSSDRITSFFEHLPQDQRCRLADLERALSGWIVFRNPPSHTRLRGLVSKAFTPQAVEERRPRIQAIVDTLLDRAARRGHLDIIRDFAYPLPATVIMEMIGVPTEDIDLIKTWSDELALFVGVALTTADKHDRAQNAARSLTDYFHKLAAERRARPKDDLLSALMAAEERGDTLTDEEIVSNCNGLLFAGHETTTNLIGNGLLALLRHPDELRKLRKNPALIGSAVEELLRYDGPVGALSRIATEDFTFSGTRIERGSRLYVMVHAANRDPRQFREPDRLDIARQDNAHLSFGLGTHYCLGAPLARAEGQIALRTLLRRFDTIELETSDPEWQPSLVLRGLRSLPVAFR